MNNNERGLFRPQAVKASALTAFGEVAIVQPLALRTLTLLLLAIVTATGLYLYYADYARRTTVRGYLEPDAGLVQVYSNARSGVVETVAVREGARVEAGDTLAGVTFPRRLPEGRRKSAVILHQLRDQQHELEAQLDRQEHITRNKRSRLKQRVAEMQAEIAELRHYASLQRQRVNLAEQHLTAMRKLRDEAMTSESSWRQGVAERLEQQKQLVSAEHRILEMRNARRDALHELEQLPILAERERLRLALQLSETRQRIVETRGQGARLIEAPVAGVVTALQAGLGDPVRPAIPLLSIVPEDATLECVLVLASDAIGFVEQGMTVRLMLDAFPHEQFGTQPATLVSISEAPVAPDEFSGAIDVSEPVYLARAVPERQFVNAYGTRKPLRTGMRVTADIVLEGRSILDWLLEPLYSLRGRT